MEPVDEILRIRFISDALVVEPVCDHPSA